MPRARNWRKALGGGETRPQVFECSDDHEWVLKLPGNPHLGFVGLCADWIGSVLAIEAGVRVPECGLIVVDALALSTLPVGGEARQWARPGVAFGSRYVDSLDVTGLRPIQLHVSSGLELARIVVTDTWLDVLDRKKSGRGEWNLLIDTQGPERIVVIDYGMALSEVLAPQIILGSRAMARRCPPEWVPYLHDADLLTAIQDVLGIPTPKITEVVVSLPSEWVEAVPGSKDVVAYLLARRPELKRCLVEGRAE